MEAAKVEAGVAGPLHLLLTDVVMPGPPGRISRGGSRRADRA